MIYFKNEKSKNNNMVELLLPCEKLCDKTSSDLFGLNNSSENPNILRLLRRSIF